jgi:hypothetical protein
VNRPIPPLPADSLTLVQVGGRGGLPEPWGWAEGLEAIRFVDPGAEESAPTEPRVVPRVLGPRPGPTTVHATRAPGASSILAPNESFLAALETEGAFDLVDASSYEACTLDEALAELGVGRVDVLDLDAPGRELAILEGAPTTLPVPFGIEVEVALNPFYEEQPLAGDVDALLRRSGYELFQFLPRRLRRWAGTDLLVLGKGQPVWAEALYLKGPTAAVADLEALTDEAEREEAIGRAVTVCLLYGFGDYALDLVDSIVLPVPVARRLRRTILLYDSHLDRGVPARFAREEHGRMLQPIATWLGDLTPASAPGRTHVSLELDQARRLFRDVGDGDDALAGRLREALDWGLRRLRAERQPR